MDRSGSPPVQPVRGEMAERIRAYDWTSTALGAAETWPPSLKATISLLLGCGFPMIALWGPNLIQVYNDGYRDLMGLKHPAGLGQPTRACWPEVWHINAPIYERVWAGETLTFEDARYPLTRSGRLEDAWFTLTYSPLRDDSGAIAGILVTLVETTSRVLADRALRESEARFRAELERQVQERTAELQASRDLLKATMDSSMDMIQVFKAVRDASGEIVDFQWLLNNHTSESRYGEVSGQSLLERNPGVVQEGIFDTFKRVTETGQPATAERRYVHEQFDGWFFQCAVKLGDGVATTTKEISAWKAAQEEVLRLRDEIAQAALYESEERFRALASLIPVLLWRSDESGQHNSLNEAWLAYTGQTLPQSQDGGWLEAIHPDDRDASQEAFRVGREQQRLIEVQPRIRRHDGEYRWFLVRQAPIIDAEGQVTQWIGAAMDIHDLHDLQERQSVLVAELQHRTRNLLGVVRSIAHQTMVQTGPTERFREQFNDRLAALSRVQGLLSRSEQEPITLRTLIRTELEALGAGDFSDRIHVAGPPVRLRKASVQTLALAMHELATNARKYGALTTEHGRLSVTWRADRNEQGGGNLLIEWIEEGIRRPRETYGPMRRGYGRELIERAMPYALNAKTRYELGETRLLCAIELPLGERFGEMSTA
ncbi:MAG TPA: HWE histidine kinase domain-containing protein [Methylobacterium sp.]|jgi:PAS domain S-box-containing protein|uniref:PAS domain-containing sensor histidine kinase n=1 Tax=Methylorubrum sp. B1-46 TaxID=2897334 RepID=UPI001E49C551|nr:HWE histidine kinase domain-containing protein [Methylorubrum sp. B1-46]UGB27992.1 PAS domain S-box protein [Methylorubrum sp. B1-46]HEV2541444.1 HWE histidine kinase domain-containing protein [Methylobacterium sp.]